MRDPNTPIRLHLAKSPCWPPYGIVCEYADGRELWDCDCAAGTPEDVLAHAKQRWPRRKVVGFDDPRHYSKR